jgi:peptidylprolyl isomerase
MAKATRGDRVQVHYVGTLEDGSVFESSRDAGEVEYRNFRGRGVEFSPVELVIGGGEWPRPFEEALVGLAPGESVRISIPAGEAYGPHLDECVAVVPKTGIAPKDERPPHWRMPNEKPLPAFAPQVGDPVEIAAPGGSATEAWVTAVTETDVTIDANHPLAGRDLVFEVTLVAIV